METRNENDRPEAATSEPVNGQGTPNTDDLSQLPREPQHLVDALLVDLLTALAKTRDLITLPGPAAELADAVSELHDILGHQNARLPAAWRWAKWRPRDLAHHGPENV